MKSFANLVAASLSSIREVFPWDVDEMLASDSKPMLLDKREANEFNTMHIAGSLHVPRGILESACEYGYEETVKELVEARDRDIVVMCRSGNRSTLAALTMKQLGYTKAVSMKTGLRGWNDYELPLVNAKGQVVPVEAADEFFTTRLRPDQMRPVD